MHKNHGPVYYSEYLDLDNFLSSQKPLSKKYGEESPDEHLFIVVHQAYELWFKQILHELSYIHSTFEKDFIQEHELFSVQNRLDRIVQIQSLFATHLEILETMTPMDFLEFRDLLMPASGFQSVQFREIEILLGLSTADRENVDRNYFLGRLNEVDRKRIAAAEAKDSMIKLLEKWLERMPFTSSAHFDFWKEYRIAVERMIASDHNWIQKNSASYSDLEKKIQLENIKLTQENFMVLFDAEHFKKALEAKQFRLSQKALLNALFIFLYRDEPLLNHPYKVLNSFMSIDENFTNWRFRHALMVQRMIGTKIGTGGSSGHQYLRKAADTNRVFVDLFNLSTFMIPRSELPKLPAQLKESLNFK